MRYVIQTLMFIESLRRIIGDYYQEMGYRLYGNRFSYNKLGILIRGNKSYIKYKISRCRENPDYYFSKEDLSHMKQNLRLNQCLTQRVIELFKFYENNHLIREKNHKIFFYHPNIKIDYFRNIDTKQKAYFLGLIFADGSISKKPNNQLTFEIGFSLKDQILLLNLSEEIGYEKKYIRKKKNNDFWRIIINSNEFCKYLIRHEIIVGKRKTYHIKLPRLNSRTLYLAFLLGFFDGDGTTNTTRITTASLIFLQQLQRKFEIQYNPKKVESIFENKNKIYKGYAYIMYLGGRLFNELLDNYSESLPRKRKRFSSYD